jgi:hypothetical protein
MMTSDERRVTGDILALRGRHIVRAWTPGVIPGLMRAGCGLAEAMLAAELAGDLRYRGVVPNMIVDSGLELAAKWGIDTDAVGLTWHAIGTGSTAPVAGNTALGTEVKRLAFASRERVAGVLTLTAFYLASESTYHIRELGVFGGAAASSTPGSGSLFSRALYDVDNSAGLEDLTVSYELTNARG